MRVLAGPRGRPRALAKPPQGWTFEVLGRTPWAPGFPMGPRELIFGAQGRSLWFLVSTSNRIGGEGHFQNWPQDPFWDPGVVKNGFLAKTHAGLTYFHNCSILFLSCFLTAESVETSTKSIKDCLNSLKINFNQFNNYMNFIRFIKSNLKNV